MRTHRVWILAALVLCGVPVALSQPKGASADAGTSVPVYGRLLDGCHTTSGFSALQNWRLSVAYNSGDWTAVQALRQELLGSLTCTGEGVLAHRALSVAFLDVALSPPALVRVLFQPTGSDADPYSSRLDTTTLYDVHLFADPLATVTSAYLAKPGVNPLVAAVTKVAGLLSAGLQKAPVNMNPGRFVGLDEGAAPPVPSTNTFLVYKLQLIGNLKRSVLTIGDTAYIPAFVTFDTRANELRDVLESLAMQSTHQAEVELNRKLYAAFKKCAPPVNAATCATQLAAELPAHTTRLSPEEYDAIQRMYSMYVALATLSMPLTSTSQYNVAPLTQVDLGPGTGVVLRTGLNRPVKVDSSKNLVDDPPATLLTFLALNYHPGGFDETTLVPRGSELFRVFAGIALTPNPGLVVGLGYGVPKLRGLSVVVGGGALLSNVLRRGDAVGMPPKTDGRQTYRGALGVWFAGIGNTL